MKIATLSLLAVATTVALPATAHADDNSEKFADPTGNIRCVIAVSSQTRAPAALCQISDFTYSPPPGSVRDDVTGAPCEPSAQSGGDLRLDTGQPAFLRCSFAALDGGVGPWPTLEYGQTRTFGTITCGSESDGVTCTDTGSGHSFRVSRDSYEVG